MIDPPEGSLVGLRFISPAIEQIAEPAPFKIINKPGEAFLTALKVDPMAKRLAELEPTDVGLLRVDFPWMYVENVRGP